MGQIPNKTYTAPDGSVYRVEADGSITKIKGGRVQSNEPPSKYQISPDGKIYRIEDDGSVTYLGNAEDRQNLLTSDLAANTKKTGNKWGWVIVLVIIIVATAFGIFISNQNYSINNDNYYSNNEHYSSNVESSYESSDQSIEYINQQKNTSSNEVPVEETNVPIETQSFEKPATTSAQHLSPKADEPINQEKEMSQTGPLDIPNPTKDNYYMELACGQMEGPDNFFVLFPDGKTYLCSAHIRRIDEMLKNLHSYTDYKIVVDAYLWTFTGTYDSNMADARLRVNSIVNYLKSKGIPDDCIITEVHDIHVDYFGPYGHVSIMVE